MASNKNVRWAVMIVFLALLFASPKPALAGADCGSVYQNGGNCCNYQYGGNCYDYQNGNYYNNTQTGSNCSAFQDGSMCYSGEQTGTSYAPYTGPTGGTYVVQWGDTMRIIADRLGIPLNALITANSQLWNPDLIYAGQVINLPTGNGQPVYYPQGQSYGAAGYYPQGQSYAPPAYNPQGQSYAPQGYYQNSYDQDNVCCRYQHYPRYENNLYTVQPHDTLKSIAKATGTDMDELLKLNPSLLGVPGRIHVGMVLVLW